MRPHVGARDRLLKEGGRRRRVACLAQVDIDHLAVLIDGPIGVDPAASQADVGLIDRPAGADTMTMRAGRVPIERREALHPIEHARRINVDTPFSQQLHQVGIG